MRYAGHQAKKKIVQPPPPPKQVAGVDYLTKHPLPDGPKSVLHVGCGEKIEGKLFAAFRGPEWSEVRLDISPEVKPDIVGDIRAMDAVADNSHHVVWSSHNIEHLFAHEVPLALKEFLRVLKPGGYALIACPDIQAACAVVASGNLTGPAYQSATGPITAMDMIYGHTASVARGRHFMQHKTGFTRDSLRQALVDAGFEAAECVKGSQFSLLACGKKASLPARSST